MPAFLETGCRYDRPADRPLIFASPHQGYVAARAADLPAGLTREADGIAEDVDLHLLPSTGQLTTRTRRALRRRAEAGATVYLWFCSVEPPGTRGPRFDDLDGLFGIELQMTHGVAADGPPMARRWQTVGAGSHTVDRPRVDHLKRTLNAG